MDKETQAIIDAFLEQHEGEPITPEMVTALVDVLEEAGEQEVKA